MNKNAACSVNVYLPITLVLPVLAEEGSLELTPYSLSVDTIGVSVVLPNKWSSLVCSEMLG